MSAKSTKRAATKPRRTASKIVRYTEEEIARMPSKTDWARLRAMTDEEVDAAARSDPDAQPSTKEQLANARRVRDVDVRALRERLELSQSAFAQRYGFELRTVQDWEQGRRKPLGPARVLLFMIDTDPRLTAKLAAGAK